jgi:integrase
VDEIGRPIRPEYFGQRFAGIAKTAGLPSIRRHDLRHTAATILHGEGVALRTIAYILGHADPAFPLRTYAHSTDEEVTKAFQGSTA